MIKTISQKLTGKLHNYGLAHIRMHRLLIILPVFLITSLPMHAAGKEGSYECTPIAVTSTVDGASNPSDEFIVKSMRKRFLIKIQGQYVYMTTISPDFKDSQNVYKIIESRLSTRIHAIRSDSISVSSLILPPAYLTQYATQASLVYQSDFQSSAWQLSCQK